jgi:HEPN domain-containing protein
MKRYKDWIKEAEAELSAARYLHRGKHYWWCCFTCQQAAEKALKAILEYRRKPRWGHNLLELAESATIVNEQLTQSCARLNRYYIEPRYPDAFPSGVPKNQYTEKDASVAIEDAEMILKEAIKIVENPYKSEATNKELMETIKNSIGKSIEKCRDDIYTLSEFFEMESCFHMMLLEACEDGIVLFDRGQFEGFRRRHTQRKKSGKIIRSEKGWDVME